MDFARPILELEKASSVQAWDEMKWGDRYDRAPWRSSNGLSTEVQGDCLVDE